MDEIWKDVVDFEGLYQISNLGNVRSLGRKNPSGKIIRKGRDMKIKTEPSGYKSVSIINALGKKKTGYIHRMIGMAFIPNLKNLSVINHLDGNKTNNSISNLEWATYSGNTKHAWNNGFYPKDTNTGIKNASAKLSEEDVKQIRKLYIPYSKEYGVKNLAEKYGVSAKHIERIIRRELWKELD